MMTRLWCCIRSLFVISALGVQGVYGIDDVSNVDEEQSCSSSLIEVTLYPNGGNRGKIVTLDKLDPNASYYSENGIKIKQEDLASIQNGTALFEAPTKKGTHFVYPALEVGRRISTPVISPSTGENIELEVLSDSPRAFYVHNFLTQEEADTMVEFSTSEKNPYKMAQSTGGTHKSWEQGGRQDFLKTRTSMNAFDISTDASKAVKKRAFELLRIPQYMESMADGIQVLRYELGQAYVAHHDYFPVRQSNDHNWDPSKGGSNRFATVFLYLSDVEDGGQTCFPSADRLQEPEELAERLGGAKAPSEEELAELIQQANLEEGSWQAKLTRDCYKKFSVKPKKGDAVLFYSQTPDGHLDPKSIHGAGPVLKGTKWGANLWVWNACRYSQCKGDGMHPAEELEYEY